MNAQGGPSREPNLATFLCPFCGEGRIVIVMLPDPDSRLMHSAVACATFDSASASEFLDLLSNTLLGRAQA